MPCPALPCLRGVKDVSPASDYLRRWRARGNRLYLVSLSGWKRSLMIGATPGRADPDPVRVDCYLESVIRFNLLDDAVVSGEWQEAASGGLHHELHGDLLPLEQVVPGALVREIDPYVLGAHPV